MDLLLVCLLTMIICWQGSIAKITSFSAKKKTSRTIEFDTNVDVYTNYIINSKRFGSKSKPNSAFAVYDQDWESLAKATRGTKITLHEAAYQIIERIASIFQLDTKEYIRKLVEKSSAPEADAKADSFLATLLLINSPTRFTRECSYPNNNIPWSPSKFTQDGLAYVMLPNIDKHFDNSLMLIERDTKIDLADKGTNFVYEYFSKGVDWLDYNAILKLKESERRRRYEKIDGGYLDKLAFGKLLRLLIIPFIIDSNKRAREANKKAFLYMTGWEDHYAKLLAHEFVKVFIDLCGSELTDNIVWVEFSNINDKKEYEVLQNQLNSGCLNSKIVFEPFRNNTNGYLLSIFVTRDVLAYSENKSRSGNFNPNDSSIISCTSISELQNPKINPEFMNRIVTYNIDGYQKLKQTLKLSTTFFESIQKTTHTILPMFNRLERLYLADGSPRADESKPRVNYNIEHVMNETTIVMHPDVFDLIKEYVRLNNNITIGPFKIKKSERDKNARKKAEKNLVRMYVRHLFLDRLLVFEDRMSGKSIALTGNRHHLESSEVLFSSLLQVTSPTRFLNDCNRLNATKLSRENNYIKEGYISAVAGPSLSNNLLDHQFMLITKNSQKPNARMKSNTINNILYEYYFRDGFDWLDYRAIERLDTSELGKRYIKFQDNPITYLDKTVYTKRLRLSVIPFVLHAYRTAKKAGKKAILYITGWGLEDEHPKLLQLFLSTMIEILNELLCDKIANVKRVYFGKILSSKTIEVIEKILRYQTFAEMKNELSKVKDETIGILNPVIEQLFRSCAKEHISFTSDGPANINNFDVDPLRDPTKRSDLMLFTSFSSNGNSYPGNEYWSGHLDASEASIAASCSTIAETQNPQINPEFLDNVRTVDEHETIQPFH